MLEKFRNVKSSCFGMVLAPDWRFHINEFTKAFLALKIEEYTKAHHAMVHVAQFIDRVKRPLGPYSEQCSETVHRGFGHRYGNYRINPVNEKFGQSFFDAVMKYNSLNLQNF